MRSVRSRLLFRSDSIAVDDVELEVAGDGLGAVQGEAADEDAEARKSACSSGVRRS